MYIRILENDDWIVEYDIENEKYRKNTKKNKKKKKRQEEFNEQVFCAIKRGVMYILRI